MAVFIGLTCFCAAYSQTAMAAVHSKTPDILGTTGKNNLNQAYKKYFDTKGDGKGGSGYRPSSKRCKLNRPSYNETAIRLYHRLLYQSIFYRPDSNCFYPLFKQPWQPYIPRLRIFSEQRVKTIWIRPIKNTLIQKAMVKADRCFIIWRTVQLSWNVRLPWLFENKRHKNMLNQ